MTLDYDPNTVFTHTAEIIARPEGGWSVIVSAWYPQDLCEPWVESTQVASFDVTNTTELNQAVASAYNLIDTLSEEKKP